MEMEGTVILLLGIVLIIQALMAAGVLLYAVRTQIRYGADLALEQNIESGVGPHENLEA
jgi:hypothetical protein